MVNTESSGNNGVIIEESAPINTEMSNATKDSNEDCTIHEDTTIINDLKIGYCIYGHGENRMLFICGGVGIYPIFLLCVLLLTLYYKYVNAELLELCTSIPKKILFPRNQKLYLLYKAAYMIFMLPSVKQSYSVEVTEIICGAK